MEFTKDMLRTGMRVVHRNGMVGIVLKDIGVISYGQKGGFNFLDDEEDAFFNDIYCQDDVDHAYAIVKVYYGVQQHQDVLNFEYLGDILWERKEETEQQKRIRELQETIKKAEEQIKELQKLS